MGPFSINFPRTKIWVAPSQWSWPINLPIELFGIFHARILEDEYILTPWFNEIEQKLLNSPKFGKLFLLYSAAYSEKFIIVSKSE